MSGTSYARLRVVHRARPDKAQARRLRASKGGKRGGRGRPSSELARLQRRFEELADKVLAGEVERAAGAVAGQLFNGARACVRDGLTAANRRNSWSVWSSSRWGCRPRRSATTVGLRGRIKRLEADAQKDMVFVKLQDGGTRIFGAQEVLTEMFLAQYGLIVGEPRPSEVLEAVRRATPESRAAFEAEYGSFEMGANIIASEDEGGWVEACRLLEDGTMETVRHEGGSVEAERIRREARERGPGGKFA